MTLAWFLIDFDNVRRDADRPLHPEYVDEAADELLRSALELASLDQSITDIELRYYYGWTSQKVPHTLHADHFLRWKQRARRHDRTTNIRIRIEMALSLISCTSVSFIGTRRDNNPRRPQQKMVDMMLGIDLVYLVTRQLGQTIFLVTSDEDLFPAVVHAAHAEPTSQKIYWVRPGRPNRTTPNDLALHNRISIIDRLPEYSP